MAIDSISLEILWNRLISIVEEADRILGRTAFSSMVRENHDYATILLTPDGRNVAQCTRGVGSFEGTLPITARHILNRFPANGLRPGDVLITNDPWLGTGHHFDVTMITPIFHRGRIVALAGNIAHMTDIGGIGLSAEGRSSFEEGLCLPPLHLLREGRPVDEVFEIISSNVRAPDHVVGDLEAEIAANHVMASRLDAFLNEYELPDLTVLASEIWSRSERAMREAVSKLPDGEYRHVIHADGFDEPIKVCAVLRVKGDRIEVDYTGSSPQSRRGINSVMNYTYAYSVYALKCVLNPEIPNNHGFLQPFSVIAPEGCCLNARRPAPTSARGVTGQLTASAVLGALTQIVPERTMAECGSTPSWAITFNGSDDTGRAFSTATLLSGGLGGRSDADGYCSLHFPSNTMSTPVEFLEVSTALIVEERRLIEDSGGAGRFRGGLGQRIVYRTVGHSPVTVWLAHTEKLRHAPQGVRGGQPGRLGRVTLEPNRPFHPKGSFEMQPGDRLILEVAGGGGFGSPEERDPEMIQEDLRLGYVTQDYVQRWHGNVRLTENTTVAS